MRSRWQSLRSSEPGQIIVLFAVFLIILMVLAGSAYDYASIVVDDAKLQNAVDAATLAGADALSRNSTKPVATVQAIASATAGTYLQRNGVDTSRDTVNWAFPTSTPASAGATPPAYLDNMTIQVNRNHPTAFWPLVGLNSVTMNNKGGAHAARGMVDVMLSLDTTYSEVLSGSFSSIQAATATFVTEMLGATGAPDPSGPLIGIARFAGTKCDYTLQNTTQKVNGVWKYSGHYYYPLDSSHCSDDYSMPQALTNNRTALNSTASSLAHTPYFSPHQPDDDCSPNSSPNCPSGSTGFTGTKLPNAFSAVFTDATHNAWMNDGRTLPAGSAPPRKILIIMTDGQNEALDDFGYFGSSPGSETSTNYDSTMLTKAQALEAAGIEVYVVGYFCTTGSSYDSTPDASNFFCRSRMAYEPSAGETHACPSDSPPGNASPIDTKLIQLSSSTGTSCDHYYPLSKSQGLPQLFATLAGQISRGQLTE